MFNVLVLTALVVLAVALAGCNMSGDDAMPEAKPTEKAAPAPAESQ